jgi:hypothetical protein
MKVKQDEQKDCIPKAITVKLSNTRVKALRSHQIGKAEILETQQRDWHVTYPQPGKLSQRSMACVCREKITVDFLLSQAFTMKPRVGLNSRSSCVYLPSTENTGVHHHTKHNSHHLTLCPAKKYIK